MQSRSSILLDNHAISQSNAREAGMVVLRIVALAILLNTGSVAQLNLQHHYDIGRGIFTSTAEFFYQDGLGSTFGFADINYDSHHYDKNGATDLYYEVARYFSLPLLHRNLSFTIQYNDGVIFLPESDSTLFSAIRAAWFGGVSYHIPFSKLDLSADLLLRHEDGDHGLTYQFTLVWFYSFSDRISSNGFLDIWNSQKENTVILLAEPQLFYSLAKFAFGIEMEISRNFPGAWTRSREYYDNQGNPSRNRIWLIPTLFVKYTF